MKKRTPFSLNRTGCPGAPVGLVAVLGTVAVLTALVCPSVWSSAYAAPDPAMRHRVQRNIAASQRARASSNYSVFSQRIASGLPARAKAQPRGVTRGPNTVPLNYVVTGNYTQPSVKFDKVEPFLKRKLVQKAARLRMKNKMEPWTKIQRVQKWINSRVTHAGNEVDFRKVKNPYTLFNQKKVQNQQTAKLSGYFKRGQVVCREKAFLTQVALEAAGFEVRLVGGDIVRGGKRLAGHSWNEVKLNGKWHIVDTTNPQYNKLTAQHVQKTGTNGAIWKPDQRLYEIGPEANWNAIFSGGSQDPFAPW